MSLACLAAVPCSRLPCLPAPPIPVLPFAFVKDRKMDTVKNAFALFDGEGDGSIAPEDLMNVLKILGTEAAEDEIKTLLDRADKNEKGHVLYSKFVDDLFHSKGLTVTKGKAELGKDDPEKIITNCLTEAKAALQASQGEPRPSSKLDAWSPEGFFNSLDICKVLGESLCQTAGVDEDPQLQLEFFKALGKTGDNGVIQYLLKNSGVMDTLCHVLSNGLTDLSQTVAASGSELRSKFAQEEGSFTLAFGDLQTYFNGLEGMLGAPDPHVLQAHSDLVLRSFLPNH